MYFLSCDATILFCFSRHRKSNIALTVLVIAVVALTETLFFSQTTHQKLNTSRLSATSASPPILRFTGY